jgi:cytoskeletal protein CcmA (bactofilin family)
MGECETVEIMPQGRVDGKIVSKELVIERKGFFVGESKIKDGKNGLEKKHIDSKQSSRISTDT